jgi:hypothetical protein
MLTKKEYSDLATKLQEIWKRERVTAESVAFQSLLNGDNKSIEEGKQRVKRYELIKFTVDECITALQYFTDWNSDAKTNEKADNKTK